MQTVETADGSITLNSDRWREHYHSVKEGALRETYEKHVRPALRFSAALKNRSIAVLDICFGLGYNSFCLIDELERIGFNGSVNIISPEIDQELVNNLPNIPYPNELKQYLPIAEKLSQNYKYENGKISIEIMIGDATAIAPKLSSGFDIIFQDPFSIMKNPELWSENWFIEMFRLLKNSGVLTTYSASALARKTMKKAGFLLYEHPFDPASGLRKGTIAAKTSIEELICLRV